MKKILSIILVLMLAFSTLLVTACNKDNTADTNPEPSSTSAEATSTRKRGSGVGSATKPTSQNSSEDDTPTSSDNEPDTSSGNPSQSTDIGYGNYDYAYTTTVVMPTDISTPAGNFDMLIYLFSEDFTKPQLTDAFYSTLVSYEQEYSKLSAIDKGSVQNYPFLQEARTAYNGMAKQECEKLINNLPDATIDNLTNFGTQAKAIEKLLVNIGNDANNIPNKNIYDQKVAKADSLLIDTFNQKVTELQTFEYSAAYKAKLDDADVIYSLMNASQQSRVSASFSTLTSLKTKYADTDIAHSFEEKVMALPDIANLTDSNKADVLELKGIYGKLTTAQQGLISQNAKTKFGELEKWFAGGRIAYIFEEWYQKTDHNTGWVKYAWTAKNTHSEFILDGSLSVKSSSDVHGIFEGVDYYQKACNQIKNGSTIEVTITSPTIFVMCCNLKSAGNKTGSTTVTRNGVALPELSQTFTFSEDGTNCEYKFNLSEAGTYVFTIQANDSIRFFALAMY